MGISRSITIGYGIAVLEENASKYLASFDGYDENINKVLTAMGLDLIGFDWGGDMMSGDEVYFFYVKGTEVMNEEIDFLPALTQFSDTPAITAEARNQLDIAAEHFGIEGVPGWNLIANIS